MNDHAHNQDPLRLQLTYFIIDRLKYKNSDPVKIADDEPIIGGSLGLDSLQLAMDLEEEFGIRINNRAESHAVLSSVAGLADFIRTHSSAQARQTA